MGPKSRPPAAPAVQSVVIALTHQRPRDLPPDRITEPRHIHPTGALACESWQLRETYSSLEGVWSGATYSVTCTRLCDGAVSLAIGSSAGDPSPLKMARTPRVKWKKVDWVIANPDDEHGYRCEDGSDQEHSDAVPVNGCGDPSTCSRGKEESGICPQLHPQRVCYVALDGRRVPGTTQNCP